MHTTEQVRLRVISAGVKCWDILIPPGEHDGYIDWKHPDDDGEPIMMAVQLIPESLPALANKPCEVRRYIESGEIEIVS